MTPTPRETWENDHRHIGRRVLVYDWLPSTNDLALTLEDPGTVIVADVQTAGRGQYQRSWQSRPGSSLLMSAILVPPPQLNRAAILTAWAAVAVSDAIRDLNGRLTTLKWPNDLLLQGKKVCGILTEQQAMTVVGIGLNLNQSAADFKAMNLPDATSLAVSTGYRYETAVVLNVVLDRLDAAWQRLLSGDRLTLENAWKDRFGLVGKTLRLDLMDGTAFIGRLRDLSLDGFEFDGTDGPATAIAPERIRQMKPA